MQHDRICRVAHIMECDIMLSNMSPTFKKNFCFTGFFSSFDRSYAILDYQFIFMIRIVIVHIVSLLYYYVN